MATRTAGRATRASPALTLVRATLLLGAAHALSYGTVAIRHAASRAQPLLTSRARAVHPPITMSLSLPGFGARKRDEGPSEEMQARYRLLGVDADATYDEIEAAFNSLKEKYEGDVKRIIKLEVAKDKILEERLRQRMSGSLRPTFKESPFEDNKKQPLIKLPPFLESVAKLPSRDVLIRNLAIFGIISLLPLLSRGFAMSSLTLSLGLSIYLLYNRGAADSNPESAAMRPPQAKPLLLTLGICVFSLMIGSTIGVLLGGIITFVSQEYLVSFCSTFALCFACTLFNVQDE